MLGVQLHTLFFSLIHACTVQIGGTDLPCYKLGMADTYKGK